MVSSAPVLSASTDPSRFSPCAVPVSLDLRERPKRRLCRDAEADDAAAAADVRPSPSLGVAGGDGWSDARLARTASASRITSGSGTADASITPDLAFCTRRARMRPLGFLSEDAGMASGRHTVPEVGDSGSASRSHCFRRSMSSNSRETRLMPPETVGAAALGGSAVIGVGRGVCIGRLISNASSPTGGGEGESKPSPSPRHHDAQSPRSSAAASSAIV